MTSNRQHITSPSPMLSTMRNLIICLTVLLWAPMAMADAASDIQSLMDRGLYVAAKQRLASQKDLGRDELAVLSFLKLQTDQTPDVYPMALKAKGHYLADFVLLICYGERLGVIHEIEEGKTSDRFSAIHHGGSRRGDKRR